MEANGHATLSRHQITEAAVAASVERERQRARTQRQLLERYRREDDYWSDRDLWYELRADYPGYGHSQPGDRRGGANWPLWRNEIDLDRIRQKARVVCDTNPHGKGLLENLINHIAGKGFTYKFQSKENTPDSDPAKGTRDAALKTLIARAQDELESCWRRNRWDGKGGRGAPVGPPREQEILWRILRDGEVFLRYYVVDGRLVLRYIEPEQVRDPAGASLTDGWSFGIQCDVQDVETVKAYHVQWIDPTSVSILGKGDLQGETVHADEVEHLKGPRTDSTIRRGVSMFAFGVAAALERARILERNTSLSAAAKASVAETWQHATATEAQISAFRSGLADDQPTRTKLDGSTTTENVEVRNAPMIRDIPDGMEAVYPAPDNSAIYLQVVQADLRAACAAFAAPEYFTADATGGTYAGLKEASAPFVKFAEAYQLYLAASYGRVAWKAIEVAVEAGRLPPEALTLLSLQVEGPTVYQRDRLQVAQESQILNMLGALSPQTICMEAGRDYEIEAANIQQHQDRFGQQGMPLGMPGTDGSMPGMPGTPGMPEPPAPPNTNGMGDDAGGALHEALTEASAERDSLHEAAGTCKRGETAAKTGCAPATGGGGTPDAPQGAKPAVAGTGAAPASRTSWGELADKAPGLGEYERRILKSDAPLGDKLHAASAVDVKVFDPLFKSGEAAAAGITHNEVIRALDATYKAHRGSDLPSPKRVSADLDAVAGQLERNALGLRKLGQQDAADWYEKHGAALIADTRRDLLTSNTAQATAPKPGTPAPRTRRPEEPVTPGQRVKVDGIAFTQTKDGTWVNAQFPDRKDLVIHNDEMGRYRRKNRVTAEGLHTDEDAAIGQVWRDLDRIYPRRFQEGAACRARLGECSELECGCEDCRAKKSPPLEQPAVLTVPDSRQSESWSCGAACVTSVAAFFGREPDTEAEAVLALGSSPRDGTDPERMIAVLEDAGLSTTAVSCADLDELAYHVGKGRPCICCCQAWGDAAEVASMEAGHYVVVCGVDDEYVTVMDPARFDPSEAASEYGGESLGGQKIAVPRERFLERWQDQDASGNLYDRYLISVKGPTDARPPA